MCNSMVWFSVRHRLLFVLTFFLFPWPEDPHIDMAPPISASVETRMRWPLICNKSPDAFQFVWVTTPGEEVDPIAVEQQLHTVAEQVNWLFWRDADSDTEARLPAWRITDDCRLDVRFVGEMRNGTIPQIGRTKRIQVEATTDYCGYAYLAPDSRPGSDNANNQSALAFVARYCLSPYVVAHEMLHLMGAVQPNAPHGRTDFHSSEFDLMGGPTYDRCGIYDMIDCGHDDYFSLSPGDRFRDRWNSADSIFLIRMTKQTTWLPYMIAGEKRDD